MTRWRARSGDPMSGRVATRRPPPDGARRGPSRPHPDGGRRPADVRQDALQRPMMGGLSSWLPAPTRWAPRLSRAGASFCERCNSRQRVDRSLPADPARHRRSGKMSAGSDPWHPGCTCRSAGWLPPAARLAVPDGRVGSAMGGPWKAKGFDPRAWRPPTPRVVETQVDETRLGREHHLTVIVIGYLASVLTSFVLTVVLLALR